jgi:hypothetical protein
MQGNSLSSLHGINPQPARLVAPAQTVQILVLRIAAEPLFQLYQMWLAW